MSKETYVFPDHCRIEELDHKKIDSSFKEEGVNSKFVLFNRMDKGVYFINESIKNFLELFETPHSKNQILKVLQEKEGKIYSNEEKDILFSFMKTMVKNGFIIPTDKNVVDSKDINEIRFDGFEIIEQLKKSKNEQVCLAINKKSKMQVVLKFATFQENISEDRLIRRKEKFKQEFQILKGVGEHSNIYKLYDFIPEKDLAVLEYIEGNTLKKVVQEEQLSLEPKLSLINQILKVLSFIHSKEIMHGDIHANQFMVQDGNVVKLIDFGFSNRTWNVQNEIVKRGGVHYYLEPENISDGAFNNVIEYRPSFHAEVYRIGVLLYFIIYEDYPFKSFSWKKLYDRIKNQDLIMNTTDPRGDSVPKGLREIISKCLQKKPSARHKSSIEVFKDWKNIKIEC